MNKLLISAIVASGLIFCTISPTQGAESLGRIGGDIPYFKIADASGVDLLRDHKSKPLPEGTSVDERRDQGYYLPDGGYSKGFYIGLNGLGWNLLPGFSNYVSFSSDCNGITYEECAKKKSDTSAYQAVLEPCFSKLDTDCISRFAVEYSDGKIEDSTPLKEMPIPNGYSNNVKTFISDSKSNLPRGSSSWIWKFPQFKHRGGDLFVASVTLNSTTKIDGGSVKFPNPYFELQILPTSVDGPAVRYFPDGGSQVIDPRSGGDGTFIGLESFALKKDRYINPEKMILEFRTSVPWTGWNVSTVSGLVVSNSRIGSNFHYSVAGKASIVPGISMNVPITSGNFSEIKSITSDVRCSGGPEDPNGCYASLQISGKYGPGGGNSTVYSLLEKAELLTDRKATFARYFWYMISSYAANNKSSYQEPACLSNYAGSAPRGFISSNATFTQDTPPTWDDKKSEFTYQLAAFKKLPDGKDFLGEYSLLIPKTVAQCLWGKEISSAKASISVVNSDGTRQVAVSSSGGGKDWFSFYASGFHFSAPKVVAGIKSSNTSSVFSKKSIMCRKGKVSKKITGTSPKCPTGYKLIKG
jgi:hypothetical protein